MWYVVKDDSGEWWYPFHKPGLISQADLNKNKPLTQRIKEFIERFQYPIIVSVNMRIILLCVDISLSYCQIHYESDAKMEEVFSGSSLHIAVAFPGLSGASDIEPLPLVTSLAQKAFLDFAFVLADRLAGPLSPCTNICMRSPQAAVSHYCRSIDSEYCTRLYITDNKPLPQIVLLPYGQEDNFIGVDIDGQDLAREIERTTGILDLFASDNPRSHGDHMTYSELGPSITEATILKAIVAEKKHHVLAYFCATGEKEKIEKFII